MARTLLLVLAAVAVGLPGAAVAAVLGVRLTSPSTGAVVAAPATVELTATAGGGSGRRTVAFFDGGVLLGADSTAPYALTWPGVAAGTYVLRARVTDGRGATASSSTQTI